MEYKCNYFLGNDPSKWHTDVPNYEAITFKDIYPGIDLKYFGNGRQLEYDFVVAPGAEIAQIKVVYEGAEETSIDADGRMIVRTKWGNMVAGLKSPTSDALSSSCEWWTSSSTTSSSDLARGADVRQSRTSRGTSSVGLVYGTYLGDSGDDNGYAIAVDSSGNAYVTGYTTSSNFPALNPYQAFQGSYDVFVTKLSSSGNSLVYSTYLGGGSDDYGYGIGVDSSGDAYVTGTTGSSDFPTLNPYETSQGGYDAFVTKLSSAGNSLIYSTHLGGSFQDYGERIAVDVSGNAYVSGVTWSSDFPTQNPFQTYQSPGRADAFVTRLSSSGNSLIYSTYLGGESDDLDYGIAVDVSGNAYVTGYTNSANFPTRNPFQGTYGGGLCDAFVTKFSSSGNNLIYSTYVGGGSGDYGWDIAVDASGSAYVTGETASSNFPTLNPYQTYQGGYDAFVTKLSATGNSLIYSTYLGGTGDEGLVDRPHTGGITVDGSGNAYVTGATSSTDFPTVNPFQTIQGSYDVFATKLSSSGSSLIYSTCVGGGSDDLGYSIAVDGSGNGYVTGWTYSTNFPTQNPYQAALGGIVDAFVIKLETYFFCGDANGDGTVDISDAVFLIAYIFSGGLPPSPEPAGDANCDLAVDISDAVYLIAFIFSGGPEPCAGC